PPVPTVGFVPRLALLVEQVLNVVEAVVPFAALPIELIKSVLAPILGAVTSVACTQSVVTSAPNTEPTEFQTLSATADSEVAADPAPSLRSKAAAPPSTPTDAQLEAKASQTQI